MSFESDRPWRQQPPAGPDGTPPPGPPKPNRRGLKIAGGVVGFLIVIGIISSATGGGGKSGSASSPEAPPATFDVTTPDVAPTTDDPLTEDPGSTDDVGPTDDTFDDPTTPAAPETVTYIVSGSSADVTYGPAGSSLSGHSPMKVTKKLGDPAYYSISAQLHGGGHVSCKLEIDGEVISQAEAKGGYNIAMCEAVQFGGEWEDANGG
jgi:hypothetical protein